MANTALLSAVASMLMQGRPENPIAAPIPSGGFKPPGGFGMPMMEAEPTMAPVAPMPSVDANLISQLTGAPPVPPVAQPDSLLQKVSRMLIGFGQGAQGRGPEYLEGLRESRERPMREFEAKQEIFQNRRAQAIEFAERKAEREQAQTQAQADAQSEREFRQWVQRTGVQDQRALEQLRQTFELERDARKLEAERLEQERRDRIQQERDAKQITAQYFGLSKNMGLSTELGRYWAGLTDKLSPAAAALDKRLAGLGDVKMSRSMGGGRGSGGASTAAMRAVQEVEASKAALLLLRQRNFTSEEERSALRRVDRAVGNLAKFPGQAQGGLGDGGYPWAKIWNGREFVGIVPDGSAPAPGTQQPTKTITMAQVRASAAEAGIDESEAVQQFKDAGYTIQQ